MALCNPPLLPTASAAALALLAAVGLGQAQEAHHTGVTTEPAAEEGVRKVAEEKERRDRAMRAAMRKLERVDQECGPAGFADQEAAAGHHYVTYQNLVITALREKFVVPAAIPTETLKELKAVVQFGIGDDGKLVGEPRVVRSSGNELFDEAVLATLKKFGPGTPARIPVPPAHTAELRKSVLKNGLTLTMVGDR